MPVNLRQVEAFRSFVETGAVARAAHRMAISQPAVSKLLGALERAVGFALFRRDGRRLILTAEGRVFYRETERTFSGLARLETAAREIRTLGAGQLVVGSMPALSLGFVQRALGAFMRERPKVQVSFFSLSTPRINELLETQQIELGIVLDPGEHRPSEYRGVRVDLLHKAEFVAILPRGHKLAAKTTIRPADLRGERLVMLSETDPNRQRFQGMMSAAGVPLGDTIETTTAHATCAFVAQGLGVAVINPFAAYDCRALGIVLRRFRPMIELALGLGRPVFGPPSSLAEAFAAVLHAHARALGDEVRSGALFGD
jgi:DNA-binding transcriptional LysR family regulator